MTIQEQEKMVQLEWNNDFLLKKLRVNEIGIKQWQLDLADGKIRCNHCFKKWWQFWK